MRSKSFDLRPPRDVAIDLLARRDYSSLALARKLREKGYPPEDVEGVVADLRERGYLDDRRLADNLASSRLAQGAGVGRVLEMKLRQRGIPEEMAREAVERAQRGGDTRSLARMLLEKRYPGVTASGDQTLLRRAIDFLRRRGFGYDDILHALGRGGEDDDDRQ
ncbi:MAG: recombination regulator RecX [Desulfuromonadia bacterium]